ncbi:chain length determinant protein tyrosine kinase EpsG [Methylobacillus sp.]|uniref:chain length determinant protein tyrosine kinase EpsG n=1 Tax=Methylobacillus sp. TaxID=56818 RepID=UPI002FE42770
MSSPVHQENPLVDAFSDFSIGSLLLRMGKITPEDAERIMRLHKERGIRFGEAAQSLGLITEQDIQQVLARQFDYPHLHLSDDEIYSKELIAAYQPFSKQVEVLRNIRSQLTLHWFDTERKSLVIAGANAGDGVSYLISNLAVVFSQLGQNTLLIDANLRSPRQHEIFRLDNKKGLSDVLAGRADAEVISKLNSFNSLSVLTAGTLAPNPQELVSRPGFRNFIAKVEKQFDVILIDAPAVSYGADVYAIAAYVRGVVLAARKNKTRYGDVSTITEQFNNNGTQVVGNVLVDF